MVHDKEFSPGSQSEYIYREDKCCPCNTYTIIRILVIIYGLWLLVVGLLLLAVGIWVGSLRRDYEEVTELLTIPSGLLCGLGVFIFIIGLIGLAGAIKENRAILVIFLILLILLLIFQVIVGVLVYIYRETARAVINDQFSNAITHYGRGNNEITDAINGIQYRLQCCGFNSYKDWELNPFFSCGNVGVTACGVPRSCCHPGAEKRLGDGCGYHTRSVNMTIHEASSQININGCTPTFVLWLRHHLDIIGGIALGFAIPQVFGILLVAWLIVRIAERRVMYNYKLQVEPNSNL
ncbi:tetraspanin-33-like isoform X1 [Tubulanus polymorphus]|uniref:tetraspanin-33-like isoform X1 n=1 Tax=Tubulanus polymorphus TaxID=672921 RepID=UPI003DA3FA2C